MTVVNYNQLYFHRKLELSRCFRFSKNGRTELLDHQKLMNHSRQFGFSGQILVRFDPVPGSGT